MNETKTVKRGRPMIVVHGKRVPKVVEWGKAVSLWRHYTDSEIATRLGCSTVAAYLKRKKLLAEGKHVKCEKEKYTRSRFLEKTA